MGLIDWIILVTYFLFILVVGVLTGRDEKDTEDYFLGGRKQHWLLVGLSILATEVSAATFLLVPGHAFAEDWWYLQLYAGAFIGKILIAFILLPAFYGSRVTTVYQYLRERFGPMTCTVASMMFFASRIIGSSIRLLAASLALAIIFDWPLSSIVILCAVMAMAYTVMGGIRSIIYTDALQAVVLVGAGLAAAVYLLVTLAGDGHDPMAWLRDAGKLQVFHSAQHWNDDRGFWILLVHASILNMAALGVDQDLTQRMLTCPDLSRARRSLLLNAVLGWPIPAIFLLIGSLVFVSQTVAPDPALEDAGRNTVFATFITTGIPAGIGLKGLLVAGIFAAAMSSLDSALGALSSSAVTDFYQPYLRPRGSSREYLVAARLFTFFFGVLLAGVALLFRNSTDLLEEAFSFASLVFGGMLGVFVLGAVTDRRGSDLSCVVAMVGSVLLLIQIKTGALLPASWWGSVQGMLDIAWPWWVVIGAAVSFGVGAMARTPGRLLTLPSGDRRS
ncbi:MAG: sodium:solute symporter family transporter [Phycisphaerae bacterium]